MTLVIRGTRTTGLLLVAVLAILAGGWSVPTAEAADAPDSAFIDEINRERAGAGLPELRVDLSVTAVAVSWSGVMSGEDRMYHNPGLAEQVVGPWERLGENVGYTIKADAGPDELVARLHTAFMESPGHRANVLGDWTHLGVGVQVTEQNKMWVTVNFAQYPEGGAPAPAPGAPAPAPDAGEAAGPDAEDRSPSALDALDPVAEAISVSGGVFGDDEATHVVLARADVFADALGGAGLAGTGAPVLFTAGPSQADPDPGIDERTRGEVDRVLADGGTVYLLGGTAAVSPGTEAELADAGYEVRRLAGGSRIETALEVAREVRAVHGDGQVLLARADVWADAISAGAYSAWAGVPVVLTPSDTLPAEVADFLDEGDGFDRRIALGGSAALSDAVVDAADAERVAGTDRTGTSVAIARELWGRDAAGPEHAFVVTPGFAEDGWAYALGHVAWSAAQGAPQLLVGDDVSAPVADYLGGLSYGSEDATDLRAASTVPAGVAQQARDLVDG